MYRLKYHTSPLLKMLSNAGSKVYLAEEVVRKHLIGLNKVTKISRVVAYSQAIPDFKDKTKPVRHSGSSTETYLKP